MNNDADWVEDVRRWYFNSTRAAPTDAPATERPASTEAAALGYEAAQPGLQAPLWERPPASRFGALR